MTSHARRRTALRLKFPGICAFFYEAVLEIIIEEVIGWNLKKGMARENCTGLFGEPIAFTATTEEQGRRSLHTHFQIWVKHFDKIRENLHSFERFDRRSAKRIIAQAMDQAGSCSFFPVD